MNKIRLNHLTVKLVHLMHTRTRLHLALTRDEVSQPQDVGEESEREYTTSRLSKMVDKLSGTRQLVKSLLNWSVSRFAK